MKWMALEPSLDGQVKMKESVSSRDTAEVEAQERGTVRFLGELHVAVCVCSRNLPCDVRKTLRRQPFAKWGWVLGIR